MEQSPLRLIRRCVEHLPAARWKELPWGIRGIYVLYQYRPRGGRYDFVYVGMASAGRRSGIRGRLRRHILKKPGLWSHFPVYEVWNNVRDEEVIELEGLFRHIYKSDSRANKLNIQKGFSKLRQVTTDVSHWET